MKELKFCKVARWEYLKSELTNLPFEKFVEAYSADLNGICVDARTQEEYKASRLRGAINLNYLSHDLADQLEMLDLSKTYYVYCRSSRRSIRVCVLLQNMGARVIHLENGLKDIMDKLGKEQKNIIIVNA